MDYQIKYLCQRLKEAGLPSHRKTIDYQQRTGKLILRRKPNGWRVVNDEEIAEIIKAFSVGGKGKFNYEKNN